jgi:hypothetical protein
MRPSWMKYFFTTIGLFLAGVIVAFLRNVALWSILMASLVFLGMLLTFMLGVFAGSGRALPWIRPQHLRKQRVNPVRLDSIGAQADMQNLGSGHGNVVR